MKVIICVLQQEFYIDVGVQEPVVDIKKRIEHHLGIPTSLQTLSVCDWELLDGLDMEDYPIVAEGTKINLTIVNHHSASKIPIIMKFSTTQFSMDVETTDTVRSLKEKIHILDGTPAEQISLFFNGSELEDENCNLIEYGIREFSYVTVLHQTIASRQMDEHPRGRRLSFVVQTPSSLLNGASIPLEMSDLRTVSEVRELLLTRKVIPFDDYLFIHRQRIMRDNFSLRWHGVDDGDFLFVFKGTVTPGQF